MTDTNILPHKKMYFDSDDAEPFETIRTLPLLDATVKETLRLYPVAQILERVCTKDYM